MTDDEIMKDLKHWAEAYNRGCIIAANALDLINRQKTEIETAKAEAIREFAEKFKSTLENLEAKSPNKTYQTAMQDMLAYYVPTIIDNLVKEMAEGEK